jgi:hypothetical protein
MLACIFFYVSFFCSRYFVSFSDISMTNSKETIAEKIFMITMPVDFTAPLIVVKRMP